MEGDKTKFKNDFKLRIYNWTLNLIKTIDSLSNDNSSKIIALQVLRSATSVGANYIEGQAASSSKDFVNFLHYSLKSANETKFWLALLRDLQKIEKRKADILLQEIIEISNILGSILLKVKNKK